MAGHVTPAGVFVEVGAARLPLPATAQHAPLDELTDEDIPV